MDILEVLKEDHKEVSQLLKKISRTRALKSREKIFVDMKQSVEIHSFLEQLIFYTALQDSPENEFVVESAQKEHQEIEYLLAELDSLPKDDEEWMPKFRLVKERIEEHVKEEESALFDCAHQTFTPQRLLDLGAEMTTKKAEQLAVQ
jgi:hemerythrin-like domain-containing protein